MGESDRDLLFVYGTLKRGADHPLGSVMRARARFVGEGSIRARLYHINDPDDPSSYYPGAVPAAAEHDRVHGEVYELDDAAEMYRVLDQFEACSVDWPEPHEFLRRRVRVRLINGAEVWSSCYFYSWDVSAAQPILSGRYAAHESALVK
jgi:gamma-glutamylcyclotransferase (GGCT)/AIG2-like uncharacterized protein YtfP